MSLYVRIKHRFGPRQMEWFMAWITMWWGVILLLPADTFDGRAWEFFAGVMPEPMWGLVMFTLGSARLTGLIINGARAEVTPWIRAGSAGLGFLLWVGISYGFSLTGIVSTWAAVYPSFAIAELVNMYRSSYDAGESNAPA